MQLSLDVQDVLVRKQCPVCFVHYAVPEMMMERKETNRRHWYCPNGHNLIFKDLLVSKLKRELASVRSYAEDLRLGKREAEPIAPIANNGGENGGSRL